MIHAMGFDKKQKPIGREIVKEGIQAGIKVGQPSFLTRKASDLLELFWQSAHGPGPLNPFLVHDDFIGRQ